MSRKAAANFRERNAESRADNDMDMEEFKRLDEAFKSYIDDMKPFVLSLPEKRDRQRIALWIKKLCGPMGHKLSERKNRNLYAQILFQMLRMRNIDGPFDEEPASGALPILPAYMSRHLDEQQAKENSKNRRAPEWIRGELPPSDSAFSLVLQKQESDTNSGHDGSLSPEVPRSMARRPAQKVTNYMEYDMQQRAEIIESPQPKVPYHSDQTPESDSLDESEDESLDQYHKKKSPRHTPPPAQVRRQLEVDFGKKNYFVRRNEVEEDLQTNLRRRTLSKSPNNGLQSLSDENERLKTTIKELKMKLANAESENAEDKLAMQQERDEAVQKVLDRKNTELEGIKSLYRNKMNEHDEIKRRQDKRITKLTRDLNHAIDRNEKEVQELKAIIQQNKVNAEHELERRIHDKIAEFEQEKFIMQKEHSQNIQELLDETNQRLKKIENEYLQKIESMDSQTKDMDGEMYQLKRSKDIYKNEIKELKEEKEELKGRLVHCNKESERLNSMLKTADREKNTLIENHDNVLRELRRKTDSTIERMKKEHAAAASKTAEVISELEGKINHYKQSLEDLELQRKRDLREQESTHKQEILRLEVNHEKQIRNVKTDAEKIESELQGKLRTIQQNFKEKDTKVIQLEEQLKDQKCHAQTAIESFKKQAEDNSRKIFQDMTQQIDKVETDLTKAYRENELLKTKARTELDALTEKLEKQITELKISHEDEKGRLLKDAEKELQIHAKDYKDGMDLVKSSYDKNFKETEDRHRFERERDAKKIAEHEQTIRELRDEVIQANSLRKQQLVELGMLRDEEKQNFKRQEESIHAKYRSQLEQQRLSLQKEHSSAMETMLHKTNSKLKAIESEYTSSADRSQQMIATLQSQISDANEKLSREQSHSQMKLLEITEKYEKEHQELQQRHSTVVASMNQELELHRTRLKQIERKYQKLEIHSQESITRLKLDCEERVRGLLPNSARAELEDTISALQEQTSLMQSRALILQEELQSRDKITHSFEDLRPQQTSPSRH
eukprot:Seg3001.2 transcript_id=Seg3001.2/GoldUCD/mRNA.D3Y31 product="Centrosomal protein of 112 kDa" protein_id=Seg3001.2/GoldUCD/D3Y31